MEQKKIPLFTIFLTVLVDLLGVCIVIPISTPLILNNDTGLLPSGLSPHIKTIILGALLSSFPIAQFFGAPILGSLSDRHGRKKILMLSIFGSCIGYLLFAYGIYAQNIYILFFSRILDGFTGGNIAVIYAAIADRSSQEDKPKNFALIGMAFGLGMIIGPALGGILSDDTIHPYFNFKTPYLFAAGLCLLNLFLVYLNFEETLEKLSQVKINALTGFRNLYEGFTHPSLKWLFLIAFFYSLGFNFYTQFFQVFVYKKFAFNQTQIGQYFTWVGICITFFQAVVIRRISGKILPEKIIQYSMLLTSFSLVWNILTSQAWMIYLFTPFTALGQGLSFPNITGLISKNAIQGQQGKTLGIQQSVLAASLAIPPICASFLDGIDMRMPILTASASIFIAWLIFMYWNKKLRPNL